MQTMQAETWVVYQGKLSETRCICTEKEWQEMELENAVYFLVEKDIPNEAEAEQLARSGTSMEKIRRKRRGMKYTWLGATPSEK
jgi:hypothetical protein